MTVIRHREAPGRRDEPPATRGSGRRGRTKARYLDAALALADRRSRLGGTPYAYAVTHVDVAQVAEAAGVSRSALYRFWDTQDAFRADLAAYLAATDDAPWMDVDARHLDADPGHSGGFHEMTRKLFNAGQDQLRVDPRPLLRAGLAGYPNAHGVTAVIAERERWRLARHADLMDRALRSAGRRCVPGVRPTDISVASGCLADGLSLAARMSPPGLPLAVEGGCGRPWSLLAIAARALLDGLTEPEADATPPPPAVAAERAAAAAPRPPVARPEPAGRRLHYLRLAARLASTEPARGERSDGFGLGYVSLEGLARAEGVTRGAVRKVWPTEAAFRLDLFAHRLARHRTATVGCLAPDLQETSGSHLDVWLAVGDELLAQVQSDLTRVSHLTFAPQLVLPTVRAHVESRAERLLDGVAAASVDLLAATGRRLQPGLGERRLAVLVLAFVDGMTRVIRTLPDMVRREVPYRGATHSLLAVSFAQLMHGLSSR